MFFSVFKDLVIFEGLLRDCSEISKCLFCLKDFYALTGGLLDGLLTQNPPSI